MGTLKQAGFSKVRQEVVHLSRPAKHGAPSLASLLSVKSAAPFSAQTKRSMAQQRCANYVQAARFCFPDGTPVWALPQIAGPIGTPVWSLLLNIGSPDCVRV
eukprot:6484610-Amphidinium_carterae.1